MIIDKYKIRQNNEALIVSKIFEHKKISRILLSKITKLNKATVSDIIRKLIDDKLIIETGVGESSLVGGQKPILIELNKEAGYIISIELGTTYVSYCLSYLDGNIIEKVKDKSLIPNKNNAFEIIKNIYKKYENKFLNSHYKLIGMAIGIHGVINNNKIVFTPYYDIDQLNLYELLTAELNIPIFIENEANLLAIGEATALKDDINIVALSIHSGVGAGIIINNNLIKGPSGNAGEIGHTILFQNGIQCNCGNKGCIELYCSIKSLIKEYEKIENKKNLTLDILCQKYKENDSNAVNLIENNCQLLAQCISNILTFLSPNTVFINNPLTNRIPNLVDKITQSISINWFKSNSVQISKFQNFSPLYGGISIVISNFFNINKIIFLHNIGE